MYEFRIVKGFEDYDISNLGNVKSNLTGIAQLIKDSKSYSKSFKYKEEAIEHRAELKRIHFGIYSPNYNPLTIINYYITNNITNNIKLFKP